MQVQEAFNDGFNGNVLKNRQGHLEDRPEAFQDWMSSASPEEVVAKRLGARADIDRQIRGVKNQALAGQNITSIEYNREKLGMLFGDNEADRLVNAMKDAGAEAQTNAKILQGSKTAETLAGQKALAVRPVEPFQMRGALQSMIPSVAAEIGAEYAGIPPGIAGPAMFALGAGSGVARKAIQATGAAMDRARNISFARAASAVGPVRDQTIGALLAHPDVISASKKAGNALVAP
jgi:hypothetical protein